MIQLEDIERKLEDLPLLPDVVVRLLQLSPEDELFFDKVLELSQEDPTFALQVIRLGNSASSAPISQINSLQEAVARVGADAIAGLITSMAVLRVFVPVHQGEKELWIHSIQVAVIAKKLSSLLPALKIDPNQAYLCGLLHDIGRFVMFDKAAAQLKEVEGKNWQTPEELIEAELDVCGFDHSKLGGRVCAKWGLPEMVRRVVAYHHMYTSKKQKAIEAHDVRLSSILKIAQLSDRLSMLLINEPDLLNWPDETLMPALEECYHPSLVSLDVGIKRLKGIAEFAVEETARMVNGLGIIQ
jgi:putative nucleotidyltransferase with HDIG domain